MRDIRTGVATLCSQALEERSVQLISLDIPSWLNLSPLISVSSESWIGMECPRGVILLEGFVENPFRPEGKLSKEADVIVGALKSGKLVVVQNVREERLPGKMNDSSDGYAEIDVSHGFIPNVNDVRTEVETVTLESRIYECCVLQ
ncbi:unnamed protein product [Lepeophtheirus salmonis]|uniref:(salmon louse) hypothetical protein n=1 Tax=Lepeophtheirus salmonis TaxID=72036 RepID=A0A7R8CGL3_LEPSM|nr:unnamed protein product [Lepeophtheirus salmonis]CAF2817138.1 unnamed protein product [Lepeophtheirus salmonis]